LEAFIAHWGYLAIVVGTFLEGEAVLVVAGAMAHRGVLSLPWVMVAAFVGSLLGDQLWFLLGRRYGTPWIARRPKIQARTEVVQTWLRKYGTAFVIGFRFLYGLRSVTPALLGASGYHARRFAVLNVLGAAIWSAAFAGFGYGIGAGMKAMLARHGHMHELTATGLAVALISAALVIWRVGKRRRALRAP
jgi:membrane protein DedA with SNARE-associated domain